MRRNSPSSNSDNTGNHPVTELSPRKPFRACFSAMPYGERWMRGGAWCRVEGRKEGRKRFATSHGESIRFLRRKTQKAGCTSLSTSRRPSPTPCSSFNVKESGGCHGQRVVLRFVGRRETERRYRNGRFCFRHEMLSREVSPLSNRGSKAVVLLDLLFRTIFNWPL